MSFNQVLDQWERRKRGGKQVDDEAEAAAVRSAQAAWLDKNGAMSPEERERVAAGRGPRPLSKAELGAIPVNARLDLHGMTTREAEDALAVFFKRARQEGWRKVLVIHGKGIHSQNGPVLSGALRNFLSRCPWAGRSGRAEAVDGGGGATWVLIKDS